MAKRINYADLFTLRADGRYMGHWHDLDADGNPTGPRHSIYDRDPERLYRRIQEKEHPSVPLFSEIAERWWVDHVEALERGTQKTYRAPYDQAVAELGQMQITDVSAADINRIMLREKDKGYSAKHASNIKSVIKQILDYAIINTKLLAFNPASAVSVPRGMKKGHVEAPETDVLAIVKKHLRDEFGQFVAVLLYTGLRTEEAAALTWGDVGKDEIKINKAVDYHGKPIIKSVKTEAGERSVPILNPLRPFLRKPKGAKKTDYVFQKDGRILTRSEITSRWLNWCKGAGLAEQKTYENRRRGERKCERTEWRPTITPHQLRHNYATVLYEAGVDVLAAKDLMGHKDIQTTQAIYTSLRKRHREEEIKKIQAAF